ncbi:MAG: tripartite tricarboxylate transporter TctB family protein [Desulfovibrionaceae bacterium]|nr:tripartite tricarboxylate transporter TctB family protein [Desulfovibrionaceae bacterium]
MLKKYKEPIFLLVVMAISVFMFCEATTIHVSGRSRNPVGPATWPEIMLGGMFFFSALLFVIDIRRIRRGESLEAVRGEGESADTADLAKDKQEYPQRGLYTFIFLVLYLLLLPTCGFVLSSAVLLFLYLLSLRISLRGCLLLALGSTAVLTFLFPHLLSVPLPRGTGVFQHVSKLFY